MAGAAPISKDTMMATSSNSVSQAAPCASKENSVSAQGHTRRRSGGLACGVAWSDTG